MSKENYSVITLKLNDESYYEQGLMVRGLLELIDSLSDESFFAINNNIITISYR